MKCQIEECASHDDCGILEIIQKQPKDKWDCSYFKTKMQAEKILQQRAEEVDKKIKKSKFKPKKKEDK